MNFPVNGRWPSLVLLCGVALMFLTAQSYGASQPNRKLGNTTNSHVLRITKLQCIEAPYKRTQLDYCKMIQFPNGTVGLNTSVTIPQVLNYFEVTAKLYYKYKTYRPFMIDWSIELCQAERIGKYNPSTALVMRIMEESVPEFYYPCPHGVSKRARGSKSNSKDHLGKDRSPFLSRIVRTPPFGCLNRATYRRPYRPGTIGWTCSSVTRRAL